MIEPVNSLKPKKYIALQALRGFAAALVVYVHALATYSEKIDTAFISTMSYGLGELGVKIFFCISGFIIFNSSKNLMPGISSMLLFLRRRLIRVAPIYWIATAIYALKLYMQGTPTSFEAFFKSILFIPYAANEGLMRPVLGQGWTLNYEMFFYVLFGLGLLLEKTRRVFVVSGLLIVLMAIHNLGLIQNGVDSIETALFFLSENYLMYFLFGLFVGLLNDKGFFAGSMISETKKTMAVVSVLAIYILLRVFDLISTPWEEPAVIIVSITCLVFCIVGSRSKQIDTPATSRLNRTAELIGDASYSTYLTHGFAMGPAARVVSLTGVHISPLPFSLLMIFFCTAFGILFFRFVEMPVLKFLNSRFA